MLRTIFIGIAAFLFIFMTTFGWRSWSPQDAPQPNDPDLPLRLKNHVVALSHEIGDRSVFKPHALNRAARYIANELDDLGFVVEHQVYTVNEKEVKNIIARKPGNKRPEEFIIVGAHYDTCFNPGANDNASGVAGLLGLAKLLHETENARTIKFIAFVNEEPPFFKTENMGSLVYARRAREKGKNIKAAVILEMIGYYSGSVFSQRYPPFLGPFYPNRANFIAVVGNSANKKLVKNVHSIFSKNSSLPAETIVLPDIVPGVDFSDHWSFWQHDYPAAMITDTAFYRYEHYHRPTDTFEKLNYDNIATVVEGLEEVIRELANE